MGDFRKGNEKRFGGGGGGFNRRDNNRGGFKGDRGRGPVIMHEAICAQCGKTCEVPFKPTSGKPVYCNACFGAKKESGENRGGDRFPQKNYDNYRTPARQEFGNNPVRENGYELKKQLEILNAKMDRLISVVESMAITKIPIKEKETTPAIKAKKSVKKTAKK